MLLLEFLEPMQLTQRDLADGIGVPYQRVNELVNGRRGVTPSTALRLAKFFNTTPDFWLNMQQRWDLYQTNRNEHEALRRIKPVHAA
jgi:addiction module HigA family antidote